MVILMVLVTLVVFAVVDLVLRLTLRRMEEARARKQRQKALDVGLRLEFAEEARSLKRVEVDRPRARILAVDDEPVILDSFRKILVLAGFSVDTVETGQEALALVRKHDAVKPSDIARWCEYVGMSREEFDAIADTFRDPRVWWMTDAGWRKQDIWEDVPSAQTTPA